MSAACVVNAEWWNCWPGGVCLPTWVNVLLAVGISSLVLVAAIGGCILFEKWFM